MTNELRDLDVHLLAEEDYRAILPEHMQEDATARRCEAERRSDGSPLPRHCAAHASGRGG